MLSCKQRKEKRIWVTKRKKGGQGPACLRRAEERLAGKAAVAAAALCRARGANCAPTNGLNTKKRRRFLRMKRFCFLLTAVICISLLMGFAPAVTRGTVTCPECGNDAHRRIIYREIRDVRTKHYVIFCYDQDCDYCGWNELTSDYAEYREHTGLPCGLCGHTGDGCTQCK